MGQYKFLMISPSVAKNAWKSSIDLILGFGFKICYDPWKPV